MSRFCLNQQIFNSESNARLYWTCVSVLAACVLHMPKPSVWHLKQNSMLITTGLQRNSEYPKPMKAAMFEFKYQIVLD